MVGFLKLAGVSAILAAGLVTAFDAPQATTTETVKIYTDRVAPDAAEPIVLAQAGRTVVSDAPPAPSTGCRAAAWPYAATECGATGEGRRPVRTITIERRDTANTSTLVRVPVETAAATR